MRSSGNVTYMHVVGGKGTCIHNFWQKPEERAPGRRRTIWMGKIKIDVEDIASDILDWFQLAQDSPPLTKYFIDHRTN
jgi:hypothetical protein